MDTLKKLYFPILCFVAVISCNDLFSQEIVPIRTTEYIINLNSIKHQEQVDVVTLKTQAISNVVSCNLDWLNYQMTIKVKEGGDFGVLSMEKIKAILIENNVDLVKFTKKELK